MGSELLHVIPAGCRGLKNLQILWSSVLNIAIVSYASNAPKNDIGSSLGTRSAAWQPSLFWICQSTALRLWTPKNLQHISCKQRHIKEGHLNLHCDINVASENFASKACSKHGSYSG